MLRLVLDTNVVLDLLYWSDPAARPLREAIDSRHAHCLTDARCLEELRRVLRLPRFALDQAAQANLLAEYREACAWVDTPPAPPAPLPRCRDADDQKFIELAFAGAADMLVTKDKALLVVGRRRKALGALAILTPQAAAVHPALAARAPAGGSSA